MHKLYDIFFFHFKGKLYESFRIMNILKAALFLNKNDYYMEYCVLNVGSSFDLHVHTCRIFFSKLQKIRISKCSCFKTSEQLMNISVIFTYSSYLLACHLFKVLDACNSHQQIKTPYFKKNIKLYTCSVSIMHVHVFIFNNMIFFISPSISLAFRP